MSVLRDCAGVVLGLVCATLAGLSLVRLLPGRQSSYESLAFSFAAGLLVHALLELAFLALRIVPGPIPFLTGDARRLADPAALALAGVAALAALLLRGRPGIDLAFAFDALRAPLRFPSPEPRAGWLAREDLLRGGAPRTIAAGDARSVLFVSPDPILTLEGWRSAEAYFRRRNPGLARIARFENPPPSPERRPTDAVAVFELR